MTERRIHLPPRPAAFSYAKDIFRERAWHEGLLLQGTYLTPLKSIASPLGDNRMGVPL